MARARNIKPGFFRNADLVELPVETRLLFIGLWGLADRDGRLEDRPKQIKMEVYPADSFDVDAMLNQLADAGFIERYEVNQNKYIQCVNFTKHQNPHRDEKASTIHAPCKHDADTVGIGLIPESLLLNPEPLIKPAPDKPARFDPAGLPLPDGLKASKWGEWVAYRSKIAKKPKPETWAKQLEFIADCLGKGFDPGSMIDESIRNGWQGLFAPKANAPPAGKQANRDSYFAQAAAAAEKLEGRTSEPIDITERCTRVA